MELRAGTVEDMEMNSCNVTPAVEFSRPDPLAECLLHFCTNRMKQMSFELISGGSNDCDWGLPGSWPKQRISEP